jgi:transcriptional regulator with XRE-family HTH domain
LFRGISQTFIATALTERGIKTSRGTVNSWAHGKTRPPARAIPTLAELLRVDVADLAIIIAAPLESEIEQSKNAAAVA